MGRSFSSSISGVALVAGLMVAACQQYPSLDRKTYPDAVVSLNQVDPAYRPYFAAQHGSNYSLEEQRAAFSKAAQTARGPMPTYVEAKSAPKSSAKGKSKSTAKGKTTGKSKGKTTVKKPVTKKPAPKKPAPKKGGKKR